eukprot:COSAG02_NODE_18390_length_941_cov_8.250594_1_plen_75_part_10
MKIQSKLYRRLVTFHIIKSQAGSEFNTPWSENDTNFTSNAQQKAATRGGQRAALQLQSHFPHSPPDQRIPPTLSD